MKKLLPLLALSLLLLTCSRETPLPSAIYDAPELWPELEVKVQYLSAAEVKQMCEPQGPRYFRGCTLPDLIRNTCHVFIDKNDPNPQAVLDHEVSVHCKGHSCEHSGPGWGKRVMEIYGY